MSGEFVAVKRLPAQEPHMCVQRGDYWFPPSACAALINQKDKAIARIETEKHQLKQQNSALLNKVLVLKRSMEITDGDDVAKSVIRGWLIGVEALLQESEG